MNLNKAVYTVFDFETTGLFPYSGDKICEIGAVRLSSDGKEKTFQSLVNPERPVSLGAFAVNGITAEMVKGKPTIKKILPDFMEFIEGSVLVAYNAGFDLGFLESALSYKEHLLDDFQVVDSLKLARELFPHLRSFKLANVAEALDVSTRGKHRALADATMTAQIFQKQLEILIKNGKTTVKEIAEPIKKRIKPKDMCDEAVLAAMEESIKDSTPVNIRYKSIWNNKISNRIISPREIKKGFDKLYVVAYCHLRKSERNFRMDCIDRVKKEKKNE